MHNLYSLLGTEVNELVHIIIENAPIGIYTINKQGIIDFVNPKFAEISGDTEIQLLGLNALTLPTYEHFGLLPFLMQGLKGKPFETEIRYVAYISKKESYRHYVGLPLYSQNNNHDVERLLLLVEDITERKRLEIQLQDTVKAKADEVEKLNKHILDQEVRIAKLEKEISVLRKPLGLQ